MTLLSGCVSLTPRAELLQASTPPGEVIDVLDREIYVERSGQGAPVLLVHGFGSSSWTWRQVMPELARDHSVLAVDLIGFGLTQRPLELEAYTREAQVEMLSGLIEAVGWDSAHVIGHSYGGAVAMALAALRPDQVRSLVLVDSAPPQYPLDRRKAIAYVRPVVSAWLRGFALRPTNVRRALRRIYAEDERVTDELVAAYAERLRTEGVVRAYRGLTLPRPGRDEVPRIEFENISQPTLVVWGAEDVVVLPEKGREAIERFRNGRMVEIPGCGHSPQEECPEKFLSVVEPFLSAGQPGSPPDSEDSGQVASADGEASSG